MPVIILSESCAPAALTGTIARPLSGSPHFIGVFRARASSKIAQKIPFVTNELSATRERDPKFALWRLCVKVVTAAILQNEQTALHDVATKKIRATRQRVAGCTAQHKRNTCARVAALRRCV